MATGLGVVEGIAAKTAVTGAQVWWRSLRGQLIKITSPRPQEALKEPAPLGTRTSFLVRGKLKHLPNGHRIWLLVENERSGDVWPQGFAAVQYDGATGEWSGRVNPWDQSVLIHAVVAPPTSDDFFRYFQDVGDHLERWKPLRRIPMECVNRATVQAIKP